MDFPQYWFHSPRTQVPSSDSALEPRIPVEGLLHHRLYQNSLSAVHLAVLQQMSASFEYPVPGSTSPGYLAVVVVVMVRVLLLGQEHNHRRHIRHPNLPHRSRKSSLVPIAWISPD